MSNASAGKLFRDLIGSGMDGNATLETLLAY